MPCRGEHGYAIKLKMILLNAIKLKMILLNTIRFFQKIKLFKIFLF